MRTACISYHKRHVNLWQARSHEWGMLELNAAAEAKPYAILLSPFTGHRT